ncbi:MAG: response regulator [Gammaproteobacteria bacterium]|nr:response regulator [Gammaproteobacteria bacterium]
MRAAKTEKRYLTPNEVAEMLLVSPITVRQWAQRGLIRATTTPGGHRRFLKRDVESFARDRGLILHRSGNSDLRILIVDDDAAFAVYLQEELKNLADDVAIDHAPNGFEAGQKVLRFEPDFMLLDLMMPGIDGFEVCRRMKSDPVTRGVRVVALTGYHTPENVDRIVAAGAEQCLAKPVDVGALANILGLDASARLQTSVA